MTIEHFYSKCKYPHLAYNWSNLFPCCKACNNTKDDKSVDNVLRPDSPDYYPEAHFECMSTGFLKPLTPQAIETIRVYELNRESLVKSRLATLNDVRSLVNLDNIQFIVNRFSYSFFIKTFLTPDLLHNSSVDVIKTFL